MSQTFNINGPVNGNVIGENKGTINQNYGIENEVDPQLLDLLNKLAKESITKDQAEELTRDINSIENTKSEGRKSLIDKIMSGAEKLIKIAEASSVLYPIAINAYELIKNIKF